MKHIILKCCIFVFLIIPLFNNVYAINNIKVSVIVPVYNSEKYLRDCLNSIVSQSLKEIEIICVNDGSKDNSLSILKSFAESDKRIIVINQGNAGASSARNTGLKIAKGEYIAFMDADDTIEHMAYKVAYDKIVAENADVLMFGETFISCENKVLKDGFSMLDRKGAMMPWNKLYKRDFLLANDFKFFEDAKCYNDECFNSIVLPKARKLVIISDKFYHYKRIVEGSIQNSADLPKKAENVLVYTDLVGRYWSSMGYFKEHSDWFIKKIKIMCLRFQDLPKVKQDYFLNKINYLITNFVGGSI